MSEEKLYSERDIEILGNYYSRHVSAMTGEQLHSKAAIAAELGQRDAKIDQLSKALMDLMTCQEFEGKAAIPRGEWQGSQMQIKCLEALRGI